MAVLTIGNTAITYQVRYSKRAAHKRIEVTPAGVEVIAPVGTPLNGLSEYVYKKRRWVVDAVRNIEQKSSKLLTQHYASGAKLQYRGRWLMLHVHAADVAEVQIVCRSKFHVAVPRELCGTEQQAAIRNAFERWLCDRALQDLERFGRRYQARLGVLAKGFRLSKAKARWGSLGRDGVVRMHWRLVQAPMAALEYVVAHELTHLIHRNHSPAFWAELAKVMPDWMDRKHMLTQWETDYRAE